MTEVPLLADTGLVLLASAGVPLLAYVQADAVTDDGGAGDGGVWGRVRPKSRGIPREWVEPAPVAAVPAEWKAPTPRFDRVPALGDLAAIEQMQPIPAPRIPRAWETEDEEDVELLLLA